MKVKRANFKVKVWQDDIAIFKEKDDDSDNILEKTKRFFKKLR